MNSKITEYILKNEKWTQELTLLRSVLLKLPLEETIKWNSPVYTYKGKNILGLSGFKNHFGLWLFQGCFLKDEQNILVNAQEEKTQAMRQLRFNTLTEVDIDLVKMYVLEAIENQIANKVLKPKRNTKPLIIPLELEEELNKNNKLKSKFDEFSLSKKREFTDYILEAKRDATKQSRLEKIIPMILNGTGLNDKYKNC